MGTHKGVDGQIIDAQSVDSGHQISNPDITAGSDSDIIGIIILFKNYI